MKPRHESQIMDSVNPPRPISFGLKDDGSIPNSKLPLLIYQGAVKLVPRDPASVRADSEIRGELGDLVFWTEDFLLSSLMITSTS